MEANNRQLNNLRDTRLQVADRLTSLQHQNIHEVSSCTPPNVNMACKPSSGAIPKKQSTQKQLHKAVDQEQADTGSETWVALAENFSISSLDTAKGEGTEKIEKNYQSLSSECPPQSLPPPEENAIKDVAKGNMEKDSGTDVSKEFNRLLSNVKSRKSNSCPKGPHSPEEVSSKQNSSPFVTGLSCRPWVKHYMADVHGGSWWFCCPAENNEGLDKEGTQELVRKLSQMYIEKEMKCKRLVEYIQQQTERKDRANAEVVLLKQESKELSEELHSAFGTIETQRLANEQKLQEEHRKIQRIKRQLARERCQRKRVERELARAKSKEKKMEKRNKKKMEDLKQSESFLVQELRKKTVHLDNCQAQYTRLQQDLEEFRAQITAELQSVQTSSAEWRRRFQESTELIAESQELCRKARQMYLWKEQECERMKEHFEQIEQKYDQCKRDLENLGKEHEEQQKELHSAFEMVEELQPEYDNKRKLLEEREYDLDRRMVEMSQAFCEAESDRMKIMKVKLAEKIRQRKKMKRQLAKERNRRKRVEMEKAIEKRRGKRMKKRKKQDTCQASSEEGSSEREITTSPDDSLENEDTK